MDGMGACMRALEEIAACSEELSTASQEFSDIYYRLQDLAGDLRNIRESVNFSPSEMDAAIARQNLIYKLKMKYGY